MFMIMREQIGFVRVHVCVHEQLLYKVTYQQLSSGGARAGLDRTIASA